MQNKLAMLLVVVMIVGMLPVTAFATANQIGTSGVTWELTEGTLTIGGTGAMPDFEYDEQPWQTQISKYHLLQHVCGSLYGQYGKDLKRQREC